MLGRILDFENWVVCEFLADQFLLEFSVIVDMVLKHVELHADQLAVINKELTGRMIDEFLNLFFLGIVKFPFGRLEITARFACHHLDRLAAQS